jgi:hypothetical protein
MMFKIKKWAAWAPNVETQEQWLAWAKDGANSVLLQGDAIPKLLPVPAMQRRRMSRLSKMALEVAYQCSADVTELRTVFASRHGEIHRTTKILHELFTGEGVSPTAFSLSVHNAASGLYSIARNAPSPSSAVAAGKNTFIAGLFEALGFLAQGEKRVLFIFADEPLPDAYQCFADEIQSPYAFALWLESGDGEGIAHRMTTDANNAIVKNITCVKESLNGVLPQGLLWLSHFLQKTPQFTLSGQRGQWHCEF